MSSVTVSMKMSPKAAGALYMKSIKQEKRIEELESALRWSRDSNTGYEPSLSVMQRYYDELIPEPLKELTK